MLPRHIRADGFVDPCIPSRAPKPPSGPDWVHEVKRHGCRLIVRRESGLRLFQDCGVLVTVREASGAALRRAYYLFGYAKRFKVSQEFILAAVASRVKIYVGKRPTVCVLDTKAAWNFNSLPRRRERTNGAHTSKVIWVPCICHPFGAARVRPFPGLARGQEPGWPGDGETSRGAVVALPNSRDAAIQVA